jgi:hypothetical protein
VEDTSDDDDDEETLQDRFQLRSRFSRLGLPHVPLVQDPPASLEASLAAVAAKEAAVAGAQESSAPAAVAAEEAAVVEAQEEAPAEAGLVDIASILGAPTVTIVWSNL